MRRSLFRVCAIAAAVGGVVAMVGVIGQTLVPSGPNRVAFPQDWDKGVMYGTVDRYDTRQYREFYGPAEAVQAAREGKPIPDGTILTLAAYAARLDADGKPLKDANGRFIKDRLVAVNAMQKKAGWGEDIPAAIRNGDWIYQSFTPDGKVNEKANLAGCYQCHLPFAKDDYLTNLAKLAGKFPATAPVAPGGPADVVIRGFSFGPGALKVTAGQSVTWTNVDDSPHQISLVGSVKRRSELILKGQAATMQFDEAGNIAYVCGLHPGMKGTIEVADR